MKNLKLNLVILFTLLSISLFAQTETKVIAVVTKADWCPTCVKNGGRVSKEILPLYQEPTIKIVVNDLTNDATKASSKSALEPFGIEKVIAKSNTTGEITLINSKTKKIISKISVAKSNDQIKKAFDEAIAKS
ncbi:MAG: hypothetical protein ABI549_11400 [Flavobacterium sp.]|uniref:hypothetical protein n=1 Tax=Flavobacterium sp. TaxID=239 RepID=UPI00326320C1